MQNKQTLTIKDFEQLKVLGKGSYAKVTLVRKISDGCIYAMKILKKQYIKKKNQEEHTICERNVLVDCDHPFIIQLKYSFQNEKKLFFVLEFCQGGELFNLLWKSKRFSEEVCRFYAAQLLISIQYLHEKDIIYRDLKPENVLIDNVGYIRITDFGLSKKNIQGNDAFSVCGTPEYLAPEILSKQGHGKAVDYWTLGCIIYEMCTGIPPFYYENRQQLFEAIKNQPVKLPNSFSAELKDLLEGLFEKDYKLRLGVDPMKGNLREHPWFSRVDWNFLIKKQIRPPYIPRIQNDIDCSNFDTEFTQTEVFSYNESSIQEQNYIDFSYNCTDLSPLNVSPVTTQNNLNGDEEGSKTDIGADNQIANECPTLHSAKTLKDKQQSSTNKNISYTNDKINSCGHLNNNNNNQLNNNNTNFSNDIEMNIESYLTNNNQQISNNNNNNNNLVGQHLQKKSHNEIEMEFQQINSNNNVQYVYQNDEDDEDDDDQDEFENHQDEDQTMEMENQQQQQQQQQNNNNNQFVMIQTNQ